jgi:chromate reductase, NAD(P)H dehydrogenase (quinone)
LRSHVWSGEVTCLLGLIVVPAREAPSPRMHAPAATIAPPGTAGFVLGYSMPTSGEGERDMVKLLGISGSLRKQSFNTALLRAAQSVLSERVALDIATLHGIPLYDGDVEQAQGIPPAVTELKQRIIAADGVLLASPEYNSGIPGVFKNAVDWLSRPPKELQAIFGNRAFAVIGASPGGFGTVMAQAAWLPVLKALGTRTWSGAKLMVPRANQTFDPQGTLTDEAVRQQLREFLAGFAAFAGPG